MTKFSANLGFLWTELTLPEAIRAAKTAGFDAVECHFPYQEDPAQVKAALSDTGLPMLALNTVRGDLEKGDFGLAALPGRQTEARAAIDQAIAYATAIGAASIHVMAGRTSHDDARATYLENLDYGAKMARRDGKSILIEPINHRDAPNYHLCRTEDAAAIIAELGHDNIRIMFDCYHTQIMQGDLTARLKTHLPLIGHIQIAAVPSRQEPDEGEVCYNRLLRAIDAMGYDGYVGAEYRPRNGTEAGLGWLRDYA